MNNSLSYINSLMNEIHECTDGIYENLCDNDMLQVKYNIENLYRILEDLEDSLDLEM